MLLVLTISSKQSNGRALGASTTRSTNAVDVILRVVRVVIVEDMSDVTDVLIASKVSFR